MQPTEESLQYLDVVFGAPRRDWSFGSLSQRAIPPVIDHFLDFIEIYFGQKNILVMLLEPTHALDQILAVSRQRLLALFIFLRLRLPDVFGVRIQSLVQCLCLLANRFSWFSGKKLMKG